MLHLNHMIHQLKNRPSTFVNQSRSKAFVLNSSYNIGNNNHNSKEYNTNAIHLLSLQKKYFIMNRRCYSIISTESSAPGSSSSPEDSSASTTNATSPPQPSDTPMKTASKEEQEMELLLEAALTQAKEISQIALERRNYNVVTRTETTASTSSSNDSTSSSVSFDTLPTSPPPPITPPADLIITLQDHNSDNNIIAKGQNSEFSSRNRRRKNDDNSNHEMDGISKCIISQKAYNTEKIMNIEFEVAAAEALLKLTSNPNFQHAFILKQQQQEILFPSEKGTSSRTDHNNVVLSLHHAFLCVIHWLCNTLIESQGGVTYATTSSSAAENDAMLPLPSKESILLTHILSLTERSKALNLPLTLPLYECICMLIARYGRLDSLVNDAINSKKSDSSISSRLSLLLLDLSILAKDALTPRPTAASLSLNNEEQPDTTTSTENSQFIKASFFANTLRELLRRNQFHDMIQLLHGMKNVHNLKNVVDLDTGMELLGALKDKVDFHVKNDTLNERGRGRNNNDGDDGDDNDVTADTDVPLYYGDDGCSHGDNNHNGIFDETGAMELAMILQTPVMEELQMRRRDLDLYELGENTSGNLLDGQIDSDEDHYDDDDRDWDVLTVYDDVDDYKLNEEDDDIEAKVNHSNQSEDKAIEKLNDLVKLMQSNIHDQEAKEAAESAAVALLDKMNKNAENFPGNKTRQANNETSFLAQENTKQLTSRDIHARFHVDSSTGDIDKAEFTIDPMRRSDVRRFDEMRSDCAHNSMIKSMIYIRDTTWEIPDVVSQLEEWNSNAGLFFSKDYETELFKEITNEHNDGSFLDGINKDGDEYNR